MRFISAFLAHLSSASSPIWILGNSNHLMLGLEYAKQTSIKLRYSEKGDADLDYWRYSLRVSITKYYSRKLILPLLRSFLSGILLQKKRPVLYLPHLSKHIFSSNQLFLLRLISNLDIISYYDDGMTLVSRSGILWKDKLLPTEQCRLIGWNYAFRGSSCPELSVSIASAYASLTKSFSLASLPCNAIIHEPCDPSYLKKKLLIASKWLDWDALDRLNPLGNPTEYCYVRHYRQSKNNPIYENSIASWDAAPSLELTLPSNISSFSHCYFGVTSTILFVLDVLLLLDYSSLIDTKFVPLINVSSCEYPEEAADFIKALRAYSDRFNIYLPD